MKLIKKASIIFLAVLLNACGGYLDIVPDNVPTIDNAFHMRTTAERFLFTCYSWMPDHANLAANPGFLGGDEIWALSMNEITPARIARGQQNQNNSLLNYWDGSGDAKPMFRGIRDCNIFLENIGSVPDLEDYQRDIWVAEVKALKAYYHFWLMRMYGPIPLMRENLPIDANTEEVQVYREPFDEGVDYVVQLLDEAIEDLPETLEMQAQAGRISKPIAMAIKAKVLLTAASPLFNGNPDFVGFTDNRGIDLFKTEKDPEKWNRALVAIKEAIDLCHELGYQLYVFQPAIGQQALSETTITRLSIRNSVTERWNSEVIWGNSNSLMNQAELTPRTWDPSRNHNAVAGKYAPTLKIAEMFYSENGVPISEDREYDYDGRYSLKVATSEDKLDILPGHTTVGLHFDREDRFYASIGFDGGIWFGQGRFTEENNFFIDGKNGGAAGIGVLWAYSVTGYWPKKLINYQNVIENSSYTSRWYSWPVIRLADLYLMYAEAYNEVHGPHAEVYQYLNLVRERAGLEPVEEAWAKYSSRPDKYTSQNGLREIIQHERLIELALEGQRYWDLRRWKRAHEEFSGPVEGWDVIERTTEGFYRKKIIYLQDFRQREYLWPLNEQTLLRNKNLVQNPGWQ